MSPILFPKEACPECTAGGGRGHERLTDHPLAFPTFRVVRRPSPGATILSPWEGGWSPADAICVHVFPGDSGFVGGLKRFGGFDEATAKSYQTFFGTIGRDIASGREAIFLNAAFPARMPFLVTHEYFHIVQPHVGGTGFPTWFLEGLADWEALKLEEPPFPNWLSVLMSEQRAGGGRPPSARSRRG